MESNFIPGLELSKQFHWEVIRPILDAHYHGIPYSAALLGNGSEVLGFDTAQSMDHDWGPRLMLFLNEDDYSNRATKIEEVLRRSLPAQFHGFAVKWQIDGPSGYHCVELLTIRNFLLGYLNFDMRSEIEPADWLTFPEQKLRTLVGGALYWDEVGLQAARERFQYYPRDIWFYLLAAGWSRIGEEEHLMGRAGSAGDEIGSALIAARLVRDLMRLCFLMEKQYAPYPKWFGTAFARLKEVRDLASILKKVLMCAEWGERQKYLAMAYEIVAARHNGLGITEPVEEKVSYFFDRPFLVIDGGRIAQSIKEQIVDNKVKQIAEKSLIGGLDQFSDSTDLLCDLERRLVLKQLY
jgi:uncharacterized protein DUF4037